MKKSLYVFLTSILGALLFLTLHRLLIFAILVLSVFNANFFDYNISYLQFLAIDYVTLIITIMLGLWYGAWLGIYWYDQVYEQQSHRGFVAHLTNEYWPKKVGNYGLRKRLALASRKLETDMWELESLAQQMPEKIPTAIKRRVVRARVARKIE